MYLRPARRFPTHSHVAAVHASSIVIVIAGRQYVRVSAESGRVAFLLPDPARELAGVRLIQDVRIAGELLDFSYRGDHWGLAIAKPRFC